MPRTPPPSPIQKRVLIDTTRYAFQDKALVYVPGPDTGISVVCTKDGVAWHTSTPREGYEVNKLYNVLQVPFPPDFPPIQVTVTGFQNRDVMKFSFFSNHYLSDLAKKNESAIAAPESGHTPSIAATESNLTQSALSPKIWQIPTSIIVGPKVTDKSSIPSHDQKYYTREFFDRLPKDEDGDLDATLISRTTSYVRKNAFKNGLPYPITLSIEQEEWYWNVLLSDIVCTKVPFEPSVPSNFTWPATIIAPNSYLTLKEGHPASQKQIVLLKEFF